MNEVIISNKSDEKINYATYFKYEINNTEKVAVCLLCKNKSINKIIKRKNGNTTGLKHT